MKMEDLCKYAYKTATSCLITIFEEWIKDLQNYRSTCIIMSDEWIRSSGELEAYRRVINFMKGIANETMEDNGIAQ